MYISASQNYSSSSISLVTALHLSVFTCGVCGALVLGSIPSSVIYTQTLLHVQVHDFIAIEFVVLVYRKRQNPLFGTLELELCLSGKSKYEQLLSGAGELIFD